MPRGLGRTRQVPRAEEAAAIRAEGVALTAQKFRPVLLRYRVEPAGGIGRPLGMWLGGCAVTDVEIGQ